MTYFVRELKFLDAKNFEAGLGDHLNSELACGKEIFNVTILRSHAENTLSAVVVSRLLQPSVKGEVYLADDQFPQKTDRNKRGDLPANVGKPWDDESEKVLQEFFAAGIRVAEIAALLGRKPGGVRARLVKLGLVQPPASLVSALPGTGFQALY